jgi:tartrate-resistant acid phosphatase type 5
MHGSTTWMQWPFKAWGADAVLAGHEHTYERLLVDGLPYFVNGLGGGAIYNFGTALPESQFRYNADYGAMLVTATGTDLHFEFYSRTGKRIDQYELTKP